MNLKQLKAICDKATPLAEFAQDSLPAEEFVPISLSEDELLTAARTELPRLIEWAEKARVYINDYESMLRNLDVQLSDKKADEVGNFSLELEAE